MSQGHQQFASHERGGVLKTLTVLLAMMGAGISKSCVGVGHVARHVGGVADDVVRAGGAAIGGAGDDLARVGGAAIGGAGDDLMRGGGAIVGGMGDDALRFGGRVGGGPAAGRAPADLLTRGLQRAPWAGRRAFTPQYGEGPPGDPLEDAFGRFGQAPEQPASAGLVDDLSGFDRRLRLATGRPRSPQAAKSKTTPAETARERESILSDTASHFAREAHHLAGSQRDRAADRRETSDREARIRAEFLRAQAARALLKARAGEVRQDLEDARIRAIFRDPFAR